MFRGLTRLFRFDVRAKNFQSVILTGVFGRERYRVVADWTITDKKTGKKVEVKGVARRQALKSLRLHRRFGD